PVSRQPRTENTAREPPAACGNGAPPPAQSRPPGGLLKAHGRRTEPPAAAERNGAGQHPPRRRTRRNGAGGRRTRPRAAPLPGRTPGRLRGQGSPLQRQRATRQPARCPEPVRLQAHHDEPHRQRHQVQSRHPEAGAARNRGRRSRVPAARHRPRHRHSPGHGTTHLRTLLPRRIRAGQDRPRGRPRPPPRVLRRGSDERLGQQPAGTGRPGNAFYADAAAPGGNRRTDVNRPHVLVIEDEPVLRDVLADNLRHEDYRVDTCGDGLEALARWTETGPDLVVLDVMLPGLSGFEICERMRRTGDRTPVLFLSAKDQPEDRIRGLSAGGDDYLVKPFNLTEFLLRVHNMLKRRGWTPGETL